jgi:hypothetical protein
MGFGLAVAGSQVAHAVGYRLAAPAPGERVRLLADSGHGYLALAPLCLALVTLVVGLALLAEIRETRGGRPGSVLRPSLFLTVAPVTFMLQEHFERLLHDGAMPWGAMAERTFVLGLLLQIPFALGAYLLARLLLHTARVVARLLPARIRLVPTQGVRWALDAPPARRSSPSGRVLGPRGPPLPAR